VNPLGPSWEGRRVEVLHFEIHLEGLKASALSATISMVGEGQPQSLIASGKACLAR
jgi:hypothetical protein